jgi:hypothetical protein
MGSHQESFASACYLLPFVGQSSDETSPPLITLLSPLNTSYSVTGVWLNFTTNVTLEWVGYSLDGAANVTITDNVLLSSLSEGSHSITIYGRDIHGTIGSSSTHWFTIDASAPIITITSPQNKTYYMGSARCVNVMATINEHTTWIGYSLDGKPNSTLDEGLPIGQCTLDNGSHSVTLYAQDTAGNIGVSSVWFTVYIPELDPPVVVIEGVVDYATYSGDLIITAMITDASPIEWAGVYLRNYETYDLILSYITDRGTLTLVQLSNTSWTFKVTIDTTLIPDATYQLSITVFDIYGNSRYQISQFSFVIHIQNSEQTLSTSTVTLTSNTSLSVSFDGESFLSGFIYFPLFLVIAIVTLAISRKHS